MEWRLWLTVRAPGKGVGSGVRVLDGEVKVMEAHHPGVGS